MRLVHDGYVLYEVKDGVRRSRGNSSRTHLTANITLNIQDIHTYDTPKYSSIRCLLMDIMFLNVMQKMCKRQRVLGERNEFAFLTFEQ